MLISGAAGFWSRVVLAGLGITMAGMTVSQVGRDGGEVGTPLYLAPEILAGLPSTSRSDVYSLGLIMYQLLAGDHAAAHDAGMEREIADPLLREDIAAATDVDPQRRPSAAELADGLLRLPLRHAARERAQAEQREARRKDELLGRARVRRPWLVATFAVLCAGLVAALILYERLRRTEVRSPAPVCSCTRTQQPS